MEDGEDCDPGANTTSTCCDSSSTSSIILLIHLIYTHYSFYKACKFTSGAVCDPTSSTCCTSFCQYSPANTTCRGAVNDICDYPEYCTGTSAECPEDKMAKDGTSCGSDGLACASGTCTSLDKQCTTAGLTMGLSKACGQRDDTSCVVACKDPNSTCVERPSRTHTGLTTFFYIFFLEILASCSKRLLWMDPHAVSSSHSIPRANENQH